MDRAIQRIRTSVSTSGVLQDRLLQAGALVWLLSFLPSLVGVAEPSPVFYWVDQYNDVPTLLFVLAAAGLGVRRAEGRRERVFWGLVLACMAGWMMVRVLYVLVPYGQRGLKTDLFSDVCYLFGYLCLALALELRPDRDAPGAGRFERMEALSTLVFAFLVLTYLTLMPAVFDPAIYSSWVSSMFLYAVLDVYLVARGVALLRSGTEPGWAAPMGWLTATFALWLVGDLLEGFMYMELIPFIDPGTPLDVLWLGPVLLLLVAVRSRAWQRRAAGAPVPALRVT